MADVHDPRPADRLFVPRLDRHPPIAPGRLTWTAEGQARGHVWRAHAVAAPGVSEADFRTAAAGAVEAALAVIDRRDPVSEVTRFNAAPVGTWMLGDALWAILNACLDLSDEVNGAFDVTLGALIDFWSEAETGLRLTAPTDEEIEAARAAGGWQGFRLHRPAQAAQQPGPTRLDFEAVAAAVAVDAGCDALSALGLTAYRVQVGETVRARGLRHDGQPWWATFPFALEDGARGVAALLDSGLGVSLSAPRPPVSGETGRRIAHDVEAVAVLAPTALAAQAYARGLHVMGPFDGPDLAEAMNLPALFLRRADHGIVGVISPALAAMAEDTAPS